MTRFLSLPLLSGMLFAAGLWLSGMTQPKNVIGFLDVTGNFRPHLALVMFGGMAVYFAFYRRVVGRSKPWCATNFCVPTMTPIDGRLILGSALFGIGWGLWGLCPGPALVMAGAGGTSALVFTAIMVATMWSYRWVESRGWISARRVL